MSGLRLFTFGSPRLQLGDELLRPDTRKAIALLTVLALEGSPQRRDDLAGLLWSGGDMSRKRASLRRTLSALNRVLPEPLETDRQRIGVPPDTLWVDALEFRTLLESAQDGEQPAEASLSTALDLYRDHFLRGFNLRGCPLFDNWKLEHSERLNRQLTGALASLLQLQEQRGAHDEAVGGARRWLMLDPLNEAAHRALMRCLAGAGKLGEALQHYDELAALLQRELGLEPSGASRALRAELLTRRAPPPAAASTRARAALLGRGAEFAQLAACFDGGARLVCVCGPPGVGKTSLVQTWLAGEAERFPGGVCTLHPNALAPGAAAARLRAWLDTPARPGPRLAFLDGCGERGDELPAWLELLQDRPELRLLLCSRRRANQRGAQIVELGGLDPSSARELFVREARKSRGEEPGSAELHGLPALIAAFGGHPGCLRMAAAWSRVLDCQELLAEWRRSPDFLTSPQRDAPSRQRSARQMFAEVWQRLPTRLHELLLELVDHDSFAPAARDDLADLAVLQEHCWLERVDAERLRVVPWLAALARVPGGSSAQQT